MKIIVRNKVAKTYNHYEIEELSKPYIVIDKCYIDGNTQTILIANSISKNDLWNEIKKGRREIKKVEIKDDCFCAELYLELSFDKPIISLAIKDADGVCLTDLKEIKKELKEYDY